MVKYQRVRQSINAISFLYLLWNSESMAKKILLQIHSEPTYYSLFGISSTLRDYKLAFRFNKDAEMNMEKKDDFIPFGFPTDVKGGCSLYYWRDEDHFNSFYFLSNRREGFWIFPEIKQADFLLLVEGPFTRRQTDQLLKKLRTIPNVQTVFEIKLASLKNYGQVLNDMELHMMKIRPKGEKS